MRICKENNHRASILGWNHSGSAATPRRTSGLHVMWFRYRAAYDRAMDGMVSKLLHASSPSKLACVALSLSYCAHEHAH